MATCTAPGHPDCTITCDNGCIAIYYEPDGPCQTSCSESARPLDLKPARVVSMMVAGMTLEQLTKILPTLRGKFPIDPSLAKCTISALFLHKSVEEILENLLQLGSAGSNLGVTMRGRSTAWFAGNAVGEQPLINIRSPDINVSHHTSGAAVYSNTQLWALDNPNSPAYTFSIDGPWKVRAGSYRHVVNGSAYESSRVESYIDFN